MPVKNKRSGVKKFPRTEFNEHPDSNAGTNVAGAPSANKKWVYHKACFARHLAELIDADNQAVAIGSLPDLCSHSVIVELLWSNKENQTTSHTDTMATHICDCPHSSAHDVDRAKRYKRGERNFEEDNIPVQQMEIMAADSSAIGSSQFNIPTSSGASRASTSDVSLTPSDSISLAGVRHSALNRTASASSFRRVSSPGITPDMLPPQVNSIFWTVTKYKRFEHLVLRLTASAGFPLSWVENPEWQLLREEFIYGSPNISRKVLSTRILREVADDLRVLAKENVRGKEVTLQSDGWTGMNFRHLLAFMVTCDKKVLTHSVYDSTKDRKTAENLLIEIEKVYNSLQDQTTWNTIVGGLVTDASGEARKARRLFSVKYPQVIVLDCYSHQVNLVVGDFFKSRSPLLHFTESATELITWLRSKTRILANLSHSVLHAVLTRWTAHYMAYRRLLQLYPTLQSILFADASHPDNLKVLISGDAKARQKAEQMVQIIENLSFWHAITLITRYLEPLAIAANITQASFCRIDQVLLTFGFLIMRYEDEKMNQDEIGRSAIIKSIETRWAKCDQEVFVAAVIVNPFYQTMPFNVNGGESSLWLTRAELRALFSRLFRRFFQREPPAEFFTDMMDFLLSLGKFRRLRDQVTFDLEQASQKRDQVDPLDTLSSFSIPGRPDLDSPFMLFARRLLSVSANSASCERLFSVFGTILTKLRNRTGNTTLTNLSEVKMHIRDEHNAKGGKLRLKRQFQAQTPSAGPNFPSAGPAMSRIDAHNQLESTINNIFTQASLYRISLPEDESGSEPSSTPNTTIPSGEFAALVAHQRQMLEEDNQDNQPTQVSNEWRTLSLKQLFDFSSTLWVTRYANFANFTFDEELDLYDILELDADGDLDPEFDATAEDILSG